MTNTNETTAIFFYKTGNWIQGKKTRWIRVEVVKKTPAGTLNFSSTHSSVELEDSGKSIEQLKTQLFDYYKQMYPRLRYASSGEKFAYKTRKFFSALSKM